MSHQDNVRNRSTEKLYEQRDRATTEAERDAAERELERRMTR